MANIKSQIKRVKTNLKRNERNKAVRSELKTYIKKSNVLLESKSKEAASAVVTAISSLDTAVSKGVLHKKTAARKKSSLAKKLNIMLVAGPVEPVVEKEKASKAKPKTAKAAPKAKTTAAKKTAVKSTAKETAKKATKTSKKES